MYDFLYIYFILQLQHLKEFMITTTNDTFSHQGFQFMTDLSHFLLPSFLISFFPALLSSFLLSFLPPLFLQFSFFFFLHFFFLLSFLAFLFPPCSLFHLSLFPPSCHPSFLPSCGHAVSCFPLDGDVPQPAVLRRRRRSLLHGGQLSSSSAAQRPPGPCLLQVNHTPADLRLTFALLQTMALVIPLDLFFAFHCLINHSVNQSLCCF